MLMSDYPETRENSLEAKVNAAFTMNDQTILRSFNKESYSKTLEDARDVYVALLQSGATEVAEYFWHVASDCLGDLYQLNSFIAVDRAFMSFNN